MRRYGNFLIPFFLVFLLGCSTLLPQRIPFLSERPEECQEFLSILDEKIKKSGVRDASSFPIPGFPYLRTNRFLSSLGKNLKNGQEREQWIRWMQQLDLRSRKKEIRNLPNEVILSLESKKTGQPDREELFSRVEYCSSRLLEHDITRSDFYETLYPFVEIPDEYSFPRRAIGLYPLFSIAVIIGTETTRDEFESWYAMNLDDLPVEGNLVAFVSSQGAPLREKEIQELIEDSRKNPLGVPWLNRKEEEKIVAHFAPIIFQDVAAPYDQFGRVGWEGDRLMIDAHKPLVYYYISHALLKWEPVLQINYIIWYPRRAGKRSPWIERGHLDGLTVRISLDARGHPFMVDVMNNCGCYHFFAPKKERLDRVVSKSFGLPPFMPQWFPEVSPGKRLGIRVNSGYHQVERMLASEIPPDSIAYELVPYAILETLPREGDRAESMFDARELPRAQIGGRRRFSSFPWGYHRLGACAKEATTPSPSLAGHISMTHDSSEKTSSSSRWLRAFRYSCYRL